MVPEQPEHVMSPSHIRGRDVASKHQAWKDTRDKMRYLTPLFGFFALAAVHCVLSASLESAEKAEKVHKYDGLAELQKIDQMEFEAAQRAEAAQRNVTEEPQEDVRYLEADQDVPAEERAAVEVKTTEGGAAADVTSHESESESSEEEEGRQRREHHEDVTAITLVEVREDTVSVEDVLE